MKKIVVMLCGILAATTVKAQVVIDNFQVGPYEVDYIGKGDVNYRLKKGTNLYEYFGLKKDTVIVENKVSKPINKAFELGISYSTPRFCVSGAHNSFGVYGAAKYKVSNGVYLSYGGLLAFSYGKYYSGQNNYKKDVLFEVGVPLAVEFTNMDYTKSSLFASVGLTPAYYATLSAKQVINGKETDFDKKNGLYIAPKVELGGYIPANEHLVKVGVFIEYRIACAKSEDNIFKNRIGRVFVGGKIGYVF
ncbi:MAG: hypothetical protein ACI4BH_11300 [Muribaculaceae bacterium]